MLDSFASVSVVSLQVLRELQLLDKVIDNPHELRSSNNPSITVVGYANLQTTVDQTIIYHKFSVIEDENKDSAIILGRDFKKSFTQLP